MLHSDNYYREQVANYRNNMRILGGQLKKIQKKWKEAFEQERHGEAGRHLSEINKLNGKLSELSAQIRKIEEQIAQEAINEKMGSDGELHFLDKAFLIVQDAVGVGKESSVISFEKNMNVLDCHKAVRSEWKRLGFSDRERVPVEEVKYLYRKHGLENAGIITSKRFLDQKIGDLTQNVKMLFDTSSAIREHEYSKIGILADVKEYSRVMRYIKQLDELEYSIFGLESEYKYKYLSNPVYHEHFWSPYSSSDFSRLREISRKLGLSSEEIGSIRKLGSLEDLEKLERICIKLRAILYQKLLLVEKKLKMILENILGEGDAKIRSLALEYGVLIKDSELDLPLQRQLQKELCEFLDSTIDGDISTGAFKIEHQDDDLKEKQKELFAAIKERNAKIDSEKRSTEKSRREMYNGMCNKHIDYEVIMALDNA